MTIKLGLALTFPRVVIKKNTFLMRSYIFDNVKHVIFRAIYTYAKIEEKSH